MRSVNLLSSKFMTAAILTAAFAAYGLQLRAQDEPHGDQNAHYVDDWSHHHLVFSNPGSKEDALRHGTYDRWQRVMNSPRFQMQQGKRSHSSRPVADGGWRSPRDFRDRRFGHKQTQNTIEKDWSTPLGSATSAKDTGTFTNQPTAGQTATITNGANALVLTAVTAVGPGTGTITVNSTSITGDTIVIGTKTYTWVTGTPTTNQIKVDNSTTRIAQNLYAAINGNVSECYTSGCISGTTAAQTGVTATVSTSTVTLTNTNASGLTWSFSGTGDFTLTPTGTLPGATTVGCSSSTAGSFVRSVSTTTQASNFATAISSCNTAYSAVGVTATSSGATVTVTAASAGTAGNSITLADTLSSFSWAASGVMSGGATATVQPTASPAKYGPSLTTASCANDFVAYPTGQGGSSSAASIIAYNNLYVTGCSGTVPSAYWAYNTGTGYTVTTSPVLSEDGTKVAFVQSNGSGAQLIVLKWKATDGTLTAPSAPTVLSNITACPVNTACMTVTALSHDDSNSSPYYAYSSDDSVYVGDDSGDLEKITGVFNGAAGTATAVNLGNTYPLASPVYDSASGCVFVGDTQGYLYSASSGVAGTVCTASAFGAFGHSQLLSDGNANSGIFDAPIVDSTAGEVYAFVASYSTSTTTTVQGTQSRFGTTTITGSGGVDGTFTTDEIGDGITGTNIPANDTITAVTTFGGNTFATLASADSCGSASCGPYTFTLTAAGTPVNVVDEFATTTITSGSTTAAPTGTETVGTGGDGYPILDGTFDNVYYASANATGSLYAVGNTGVTTGATLYRIPIANSVMSAPVSSVTALTPNAANAYPWPSSLSEFCNGVCTTNGTITNGGGSDYLFFSVNQGSGTLCTTGSGTGCILSYKINNPAAVTRSGGQHYTNPTGTGCWATGGIVIDNSDQTTTGASQIYFVSLAGATAGGPNGTTSSNCDPGTAPTINAIQGSQVNP